VANDAGWPTGTGYTVALTDQAGNTYPGYPMQWQLLNPGSTYNLAQGLPLARASSGQTQAPSRARELAGATRAQPSLAPQPPLASPQQSDFAAGVAARWNKRRIELEAAMRGASFRG
jgi:hypothetical protein